MSVTFDDVRETATGMGLDAMVTRDDNGRMSLSVWRQADDWSMAPTVIATASNDADVAARGLLSLRQLVPQIQKRLAAEQNETEPYARIHPDDIEAIGEAVARAMRPGTVS